jgi:outer membrane protein TolC
MHFLNKLQTQKNNMKNSPFFFSLPSGAFGAVFLLFFFWGMPFFAVAQYTESLTLLFQAWEENNPEANVFFLQKEAQQAREKLAFTLPGLSLEGQYGQINSSYAQDYQLNARIEPLQLFGVGKRRAALRAGRDVLEAEQAQTRLWGHYQVKKAFLTGSFAELEVALYEVQLKQASRYLEAARVQTESGASSALALQRARTLQQQLQLRKAQAQQRAQAARTQLANLTGKPSGEVQFSLSEKLQNTLASSTDSLPPHLRLARAEAQQRSAESEATQSEALPQLGASAFTQQIDGLGGLFGAGLVLHIPLGNGAKRRAAVQNLEAKVFAQKADFLALQYKNTQQAMELQWQQAQKSLQFADSAAVQAQATRQLLRQQLEHGAIDFLQFYLAQESAFLAEREALATRQYIAFLRLDVELLNGEIHANEF